MVRHGLVQSSLFFRKPWKKQPTYHDLTCDRNGPVTRHTHAELDQWWPTARLQRYTNNVEVLRDFPWHSHHYLLKVTLAIAVQQCKPPPEVDYAEPGYWFDRTRLHSPLRALAAERDFAHALPAAPEPPPPGATEQQRQQYLSDIRQGLMAAAQEVKQRHLKVKRTPTTKKHHFCKDTVAHLLASLAEGTPAEERRAHRHCFKQCARRDNRRRTRYRLARAKHRWQQVSPMLRATGKKKLTNASCVRNLEGDLRPASEAAEGRAVYLAQSL